MRISHQITLIACTLFTVLCYGCSANCNKATNTGKSFLTNLFTCNFEACDAMCTNNGRKDVRLFASNLTEEDLANIIYEYGEERFAKKIANNICEYRKNKKIETTGELVKIIEKSVKSSYKLNQGHPAKRTFQAIRIEVNNEIKPLYNLVIDSINCLEEKGRLCIITFHSLEDRAVKKALTEMTGKCTCPPDLPYCVCGKKSLGKIITKKPILPSEEEIITNSRSKSAKLRVFEKE